MFLNKKLLQYCGFKRP